MKYGETLRQRSIPAWGHHNIDYDDIKYFIKEHTTPGQGKSVSVPGRGDDKLAEIENALFVILVDQHQRIDLFVKSKAGEIQRRLEHARKQLRSLSSRNTTTADNRIPVSRLERYGRLENDVIKAGDEIKSLARFTATQRTAFRKLLKKYKKWTGSSELEARFRDEVLDNPKGFTNIDLGPLLDEYSTIRQRIRALYENQVQQSNGDKKVEAMASSAAIRQLQDVVKSGSKVYFDTNIATVPLGESGTFASYFVHPENIVELQVLLLQYARFYFSRSRSNSIASPITSEPARSETFAQSRPECADYHMLVADNLERFVKEQSALTVDDREHKPGMFPQRAKATVRWNNDEDALACLRSKSGKTKSAYLRRKNIYDFFDGKTDFLAKQDAAPAETTDSIAEVRRELIKDDTRPLFHFSSCRTRLIGDASDANGMVLATLDTGITIAQTNTEGQDEQTSSFPFALLLVRQEGTPKSELLAALDRSHLVERVRGFSLEYHSIWQTHRPKDIPSPFWEPLLSRDIRKLPPPAMALKRSGTTTGSTSGTQSAGSSGSQLGGTDSGTAVETSPLETTPLKFFRKKKRRAYPEAETGSQQPQERYWNEYDHPEDDDHPDADAFVIYVDPNQESVFDRFFDRIGKLFGQKQYAEDERQALLNGGSSPDDEESSDDETSGAAILGTSTRPATHFGTFSRPAPSSITIVTQQHHANFPILGHFASVCYAASLVLLAVAYIFHTTARHRYLRSVHFGVLLCMISSLIFVAMGLLAVAQSGSKARPVRPAVWIISGIVLTVDAVGSGGLLAWILG